MDKLIIVGKLEIKGMDIVKRVYSPEGISPTLTDMQGGNRQPKVMIKEAVKKSCAAAIRGRPNKAGKVEQQIEISNREYANAITTIQKDSMVAQGLRIRRLTPLECWRLMAFDDEDFYKAEAVNSNTQLYKQAGNSIVVSVMEAIFQQFLI